MLAILAEKFANPIVMVVTGYPPVQGINVHVTNLTWLIQIKSDKSARRIWHSWRQIPRSIKLNLNDDFQMPRLPIKIFCWWNVIDIETSWYFQILVNNFSLVKFMALLVSQKKKNEHRRNSFATLRNVVSSDCNCFFCYKLTFVFNHNETLSFGYIYHFRNVWQMKLNGIE